LLLKVCDVYKGVFNFKQNNIFNPELKILCSPPSI